MAEESRSGVEGPVCVTGASGFIGSWLVMRLLQQGFTVRATVRDPDVKTRFQMLAQLLMISITTTLETGNLSKTRHLLDLPAAKDRLTLWRGDLEEEGSFDGAFDGCRGVFHMATPMDFHSQNPQEEVIKPTVEGMLNVMRSCAKAKSVRRVVFTSSAGTVSFADDRSPGQVFDESCWTDVLFCRRRQMTGWMYFVSKTLAEKAAWEFAEQNKIDLITVIPTLVVGPFIMPTMPPSLITALALITRNEAHYSILRQVGVVHLEDVCNAHIFLYRHAEAKGRYICSAHDTTILRIAKMLAQKYPQYDVPTQFEDADEALEVVKFSLEKLMEMGFKYRYSMEDMFDGAIQSCREKGLL